MDQKKISDVVRVTRAMVAAHPAAAVLRFDDNGQPLRSSDGLPPLSATQLAEIRDMLVVVEGALSSIRSAAKQP